MDWNSKQSKALLQAILLLETPDEAKRFLRDLMTEGEIQEFGKRLQAADLLTQNVPYSVIEEKTGLSSTTVARVSKWLNGDQGGYKAVLAKIHHHDSIQTRRGLS